MKVKILTIISCMIVLAVGWGILASNNNSMPASPAASTPPPAAPLTAAEIALHHTQSDCWVYLNPINKVYNITGFVANANKHPGGNVIISHCGTNIYSYFLGSAGGHTHSNNSLSSILESYYIGPFQK